MLEQKARGKSINIIRENSKGQIGKGLLMRLDLKTGLLGSSGQNLYGS